MITSGLVVQNHGKGIFPSSRSRKRTFVRPYVDGYDKPIPSFSRPFDEKFTKTVNYHKVFGKGVTPDEKLYYLEHDMFQTVARANAMPLKRKTRKRGAAESLEGSTLMDKYMLLEKFKSPDFEPFVPMEGIENWQTAAARNPEISEGRKSTVSGEIDVDKKSVLQSVAPSSGDYNELQEKVLNQADPVKSKLLDEGDGAALMPMLEGVAIQAVDDLPQDQDVEMQAVENEEPQAEEPQAEESAAPQARSAMSRLGEAAISKLGEAALKLLGEPGEKKIGRRNSVPSNVSSGKSVAGKSIANRSLSSGSVGSVTPDFSGYENRLIKPGDPQEIMNMTQQARESVKKNTGAAIKKVRSSSTGNLSNPYKTAEKIRRAQSAAYNNSLGRARRGSEGIYDSIRNSRRATGAYGLRDTSSSD